MKLFDPKSFDISFKKIPLRIDYQRYPNSDSRAIFKKVFWQQPNGKSMWDSDSVADHQNIFPAKMEIDIKDFDSLRIVVSDNNAQNSVSKRKYIAVLPKKNIDIFKLELINKIQSQYKFIYRLGLEMYSGPTLYSEDLFEYDDRIFEITQEKNYYKTYDSPSLLKQLFSFKCKPQEVSHFKLRAIHEESIDNFPKNEEEKLIDNKSNDKSVVLDIKEVMEYLEKQENRKKNDT